MPDSTPVHVRREIVKISPLHEAMVNLVIYEPRLNHGEIAERLGVRREWVGVCLASKVFKERLNERMSDLVDPTLLASISERFEGMLLRLIELINKELGKEDVPIKTTLRAFELVLRASGYGGSGAPQKPLDGLSVHVHLENMAHSLTTLLRKEKARVVSEQ